MTDRFSEDYPTDAYDHLVCVDGAVSLARALDRASVEDGANLVNDPTSIYYSGPSLDEQKDGAFGSIRGTVRARVDSNESAAE